MEILVFGKDVGKRAYIESKTIKYKEPNSIHISKAKDKISSILSHKSKNSFYKLRKDMGKILFEKVGIIRDTQSLKLALKNIEEIELKSNNISIKDKKIKANLELIEFLEFKNLLRLAPIVISMAIKRTKTLGAHIIKS